MIHIHTRAKIIINILIIAILIIASTTLFGWKVFGVAPSNENVIIDDGGGTDDLPEITDNYLNKKNLYRALKACYGNETALNMDISYEKYTGTPNFYGGEWGVFSGTAAYKKMPTYIGNNFDGKIQCAFEKASSFSADPPTSLLLIFASNRYNTTLSKNGTKPIIQGNQGKDYLIKVDLNKVDINNFESRNDFYVNMGYEASNDNGDNGDAEACYRAYYGPSTEPKKHHSNKLCIKLGKDGKISEMHTDNTGESIKDTGEGYSLLFSNSGQAATLELNVNGSIGSGESKIEIGYIGDDTLDSFDAMINTLNDNNSPTGFAQTLGRVTISDNSGWYGTLGDVIGSVQVEKTNPDNSDDDSEVYTNFKISSRLKAFKQAVTFFNGSDDENLYSNYNTTELYYIYMKYLEMFGAEINYELCNGLKYPDDESFIPTVFDDENGKKTKEYCSIGNYQDLLGYGQSPKKTLKLRTGNNMETSKEYGIDEMAQLIRDLGINHIYTNRLSSLGPLSGYQSPLNTNSSGGQPPKEEKPDCYDAGLDSMAWVLCPTITNVSTTASVVEGLLKDWLTIDPETTVNKDSTYKAWGIFRNIANVLLIIILLAIIFSQLTGFGIDNYGIKKMLPKLIAMAIIINLSYILCEVAIDISNILGVSLNNLFQAIAAGIGNGEGADMTVSYLIAELFALVGVGGVVAGLAGSGGGIMLAITILIAVLVAAVAVMIFFMMLAARMMIVVLFTVVAPVALVLYILPNTQQYYKKWWKTFWAALVVYPICGALLGVSALIKSIIISKNNIQPIPGVIAIIAPFLPFFALPSLLKGALAGLGVVGGALTALGNSMKKNVSNAGQSLKKSEGLQDFNTQWKAGYKSDGTRKNLNGLQKFIRGGKRGVANSALKYKKVVAEKGARESTEGEDFMLATETANEAQNIVASGEINNSGALESGLEKALKENNRAKIRAYTDALNSKGEDGRDKIRKVYNDLVERGGLSGAAAKAFADNILTNHGADFKNNDRTMYEIVKGINSVGMKEGDTQEAYEANIKAAAISTNTFKGDSNNIDKLRSKVTVNTIGNMGDQSFQDTFHEIIGADGKLNANANVSYDAEIGKIAYEAMHGPNAANIKKDRMEALQKIVDASGYTPDSQTVEIKDGSQTMNTLNTIAANTGSTAANTGQTAANTERSADGIDSANEQLKQIHHQGKAQLDAAMAQLDDQTLGEIATDPKLSNDDPKVQAAQAEWMRRERERGNK